jgi:TRAP-type C4-dicarboxylate transport system permease large subunit
MCEIALITPPVGMNLYVVQGVRRTGSVSTVFAGALPFVGCLFFVVAVLTVVPELVTWLPQSLR